MAVEHARLYSVTRSGVSILTKDYRPPLWLRCCSTGIDMTHVPWAQVHGLSVDIAGSGCSCLRVSVVRILLPHGECLVWKVDEPARVAAYLQRCKSEIENKKTAVVIKSRSRMCDFSAPSTAMKAGQPSSR